MSLCDRRANVPFYARRASACLTAALLLGGVSSVRGPAAAQTTPAAPAQPVSVVTLNLSWKAPVDPTAIRIAVADTVGDGKQRLVTLCRADTTATKVTVSRWQGSAFTQEWSADLPEPVSTFAVGRFDPTAKAAEIVTRTCWFMWDGSKYARHELSAPVIPAGVIQRKDNVAILLAREKGTFAAYTMDTKATGEGFVRKDSLPDDSSFFFGRMYAPPSELVSQMPPDCAICGFFAFWNPADTGRPARLVGQYNKEGPNAGSFAVLAASIGQNAVIPSWKSPALEGPIGDLCFGDPKSENTPGLAILTITADGKGRSLSLYVPVKAAAPAK